MSTKRQLREQAEAEQQAVQSDSRTQTMMWAYLVVCALLVAAVVISWISADVLIKNMRSSKNVQTSIASYTPWPDEVRAEFQKMLVQNGGRVKPMNTFARYSLMQINNGVKVKFQTKDGEQHKIKADAWMLDALFRTDLAKEYPIFNVDDTAAVSELGLSPKPGDSEHRKRDRYSYNQLVTIRPKLAEETSRISEKQQKYTDSDEDPAYKLTRIEEQLLRLGRNINFFEHMAGQFGLVKKGEQMVYPGMLPASLAEFAGRMDVAEFLEIMPQMSPQQLFGIVQGPADTEEAKLLQAPFSLLFFYANSGRYLVAFPPIDDLDDEWGGIGEGLFLAMADKSKREWVTKNLRAVEGVYTGQKAMFAALAKLPSGADEASRAAIIKPVADSIRALVDGQNETAQSRYDARIARFDEQIAANDEPLEDLRLKQEKARLKLEGATALKEVKHYNKGYFHSAVGYYGLGFVVLAFSWFLPGTRVSKYLIWAAVALIVFGLYYNTAGIVMRSIVRERPPITNLYDTVIFITACLVLLSLLLELFTRKGIGLIVAAVGGMAGMFLSFRHETAEATDTMDPLQAVLDTNFWLATHVTTINIGYAAGLLAMLLGTVYLLIRFLRPIGRVFSALTGGEPLPEGGIFKEDKKSRDLHRTITGMTYGVVCFCLLFSIVGTILGGVWANYSWGRFWGWDPKENGALMICLWSLVILHARMGGYIRDIGIAVNSIFLGMIVTFSWWGVNNLGIGLHSYGFTEGVWKALFISWIVSLLIMACAIPLWLHERFKKAAKKQRKQDQNSVSSETDLPPEGAPA